MLPFIKPISNRITIETVTKNLAVACQRQRNRHYEELYSKMFIAWKGYKSF